MAFSILKRRINIHILINYIETAFQFSPFWNQQVLCLSPYYIDCSAEDQGNCPASETAGAETSTRHPGLTAQQMRLQGTGQQQLMNVALPTPDRITRPGSKPKTIWRHPCLPKRLGLYRGHPVPREWEGMGFSQQELPLSPHSLHGVSLTVQRYPFSWTNIGRNFANFFCTCMYILGKHFFTQCMSCCTR